LRVPIAIGRFYKQCLWIPQMFLLTNPDLHHGLLGQERIRPLREVGRRDAPVVRSIKVG